MRILASYNKSAPFDSAQGATGAGIVVTRSLSGVEGGVRLC
jgi:hypothetical protein